MFRQVFSLLAPPVLGLFIVVYYPNLLRADAVLVDATAKRQSAVKSLDITYKVTEVFAAGGISKTIPQAFDSKQSNAPPNETTIQSTNRLLFDLNRLRIENNHPIWHLEQNQFRPNQFISVFNGEHSKQYHPAGIGTSGRASGVIMKNAKNHDIKSYLIAPITFVLRGNTPAISPYSPRRLSPTGTQLPIQGTACHEYLAKITTLRTLRCWIDPARGSIPLRMQLANKDKLSEQYDIEYKTHESGEWLPQSWKRSLYSPDGSVLCTTTVIVHTATVNQPCRKSSFDIRYPAGVLVYDQRTGKDYRIQSDGSMREISTTGEDLDNTVPQPGTPWHERHRWLLISIAICMSVVLAIFLRSRINKR